MAVVVRFHFDRDLFATVRPADVAAIARVAAATLASVVPSDYFCDCFSSQRLPIRANLQQALMATKQGAAPDAAPRKIPNSLDSSDFLEIMFECSSLTRSRATLMPAHGISCDQVRCTKV